MIICYILSKRFGALGEVASYIFAKELSTHGHNIHVIALGGLDPEFNKAEVPNIDIYDLASIPSLKERIKLVNDYINEIKPDIVHVFFQRGIFLYPLYCKILNNKNKDSKWLLDIRSPLLTKGPKRLIGKIFGVLEQIGFDAIGAPVEHTVKSVLTIPLKKRKIIPIGVSTDQIKVKDLQFNIRPHKIRKFVYVGSISRLRKLGNLIQAISIFLKKNNENINFQFDFYGNGDALQELKNMVYELHLSDYIHFKDRIKQVKLFKMLSSYDVGLAYIPGNEYEYSPGLKTLEYMAAGLIVLASNTHGNRLFIKDKENGYLMNNNEIDIYNALKEINNSDYDKLRNEAREEALKWDWKIVISDYLIPLYKDLILQ